jgi:hypothetical protein
MNHEKNVVFVEGFHPVYIFLFSFLIGGGLLLIGSKVNSYFSFSNISLFLTDGYFLILFLSLVITLLFSIYCQESKVSLKEIIIQSPYNPFQSDKSINIEKVQVIKIKNITFKGITLLSGVGVYIGCDDVYHLTSMFLRVSRKRALSLASELSELFMVNLEIKL